MKAMQQLSFLPDRRAGRCPPAAPKRPVAKSAPPAPNSFPVDAGEVINSIDDAVEHMGLELGRLGTVLKRVTDYGLLGSFSALYAQNLVRYADLLLKKKMLEEQPADALLELLEPALERLNQSVELEL